MFQEMAAFSVWMSESMQEMILNDPPPHPENGFVTVYLFVVYVFSFLGNL